jgi:hypothetical protein
MSADERKLSSVGSKSKSDNYGKPSFVINTGIRENH